MHVNLSKVLPWFAPAAVVPTFLLPAPWTVLAPVGVKAPRSEINNF